MKKYLSLLLAALTSVLLLSGCYQVNGTPSGKICGTYVLTTLRLSRNATSSESAETIDMLEDKHAVSFIVVSTVDGATGTGYYYYGDDDTDAFCCKVDIAFTYDEEKTDYITYVEFTYTSETSGKVKLGVSGKLLNAYLPSIKLGALVREYSKTTYYTLKDSAKDLSYIEKTIGKTVTVTE